MIIYPAMDLIKGRAVRLQKGRFDEVTSYPELPGEALRKFASAGAQWAHVVDLDGARLGQPAQHQLIGDLARSAPLKLQVAGGFREREHLARMFDAGVARVVIGSLAASQPETVSSWIEEFGPERVAISLDVRLGEGTPMVAVAGWTKDSGQSLWDLAAQFPGARHLLVTDIDRDGMLQGPNVALYEKIAEGLPGVFVQASGGISSLRDLECLATDGAIIGKALWEGRLSLEEAIGLARA